jgi:hypothetical protein
MPQKKKMTAEEMHSIIEAQKKEFFTVLLVFLPESGGIRSIPGIPRN